VYVNGTIAEYKIFDVKTREKSHWFWIPSIALALLGGIYFFIPNKL